jgi:hypothetical protein
LSRVREPGEVRSQLREAGLDGIAVETVGEIHLIPHGRI